MTLASIPSPSQGVWHIGDFPIRGYAMAIVVGIIIAIVVGDRRLQARGAAPGALADIAFWAVPFGIIGGRIYHVITTPEPYFGSGGDPAEAFMIWKGGLGIWGAIAFGGVGAWIGARRLGILLAAGRRRGRPRAGAGAGLRALGELVQPGALRTADGPALGPGDRPGQAARRHPGHRHVSPDVPLRVPLVHRRRAAGRLGGPALAARHGQAFALYVAAYCVGRFWIEALRIDTAEHVLGMRLNNWTAILLFAGSVAYIVWSRRRFASREPGVYRAGNAPGEVSAVG